MDMSKGVLAAVMMGAALVWPVHEGSGKSKTGELTVEVSGFRNSKGNVRGGLFTSDDGFPLDVEDVKIKRQAPVKGGKATLVFKNVPHRDYAVVVYHDEDANGELDTNWVGMPNEGAGVFKPVTSRVPPPDFEDCKFRFDQKKRKVKVSLNYL